MIVSPTLMVIGSLVNESRIILCMYLSTIVLGIIRLCGMNRRVNEVYYYKYKLIINNIMGVGYAYFLCDKDVVCVCIDINKYDSRNISWFLISTHKLLVLSLLIFKTQLYFIRLSIW